MKTSAKTPRTFVRIAHTFRALRSRNYRLFFAGQGLSLIGTWMQQIAMSWLVYRLTNSLVLLGVVGFCSQIPAFVLGPFAGVISDRLPKRGILLCTQTLALVQAFTLTVLVYTDSITVPHIIGLSLFMGLITAFDAPARQSFVIELVEKREDLGNAIALNSAIFNGARLIGPAVAGLIIAAAGEGICFLLNTLSYSAVIIALLLMRVQPQKAARSGRRIFREMKEGIGYAFGFPPIRAILLLMAAVNLFGVPYSTLGPAFARDVLHGGAHTLGFLHAAAGTGALCAALFMASRRTVRGLVRGIPLVTVAFGIGLMLYSQSHVLALSLLALFFSGFMVMFYMAASNTVLQTIVEDHLRGRVMSFYAMAFFGMAPFGSLLAGSVAERIGAPATVFWCGVCASLGGLLFASQLTKLRGAVRSVYVKKGIILEVEKDLQIAKPLD